MHRFLLHNGEIHEASENLLSPGQVGFLNGWGVFSTIRVMDGVLFAFERHWARMKRDAALLRVPFPADPQWLEDGLLRLVEANHAINATLRVAVVRNLGGIFQGPAIDRAFDVVAFTADIRKWGTGVRLALVPQARHAACRFAGTKILSWCFNLAWLEEAQERGYDEALLLNERGELAECTSANIFAAKGDQVWTPPLSSGCLPGVTRELLLEEVRAPGITVCEKTLFPADLETADDVFITSTTRDLLQVYEIEGLTMRRQGEGRAILEAAFGRYLDTYVSHTRPKAGV